MQRTQTRLRIGFGLVAMVAVLALVAFMTMVSTNSGTNSVSALGPTPTTEPNPGSGGFLSGIVDVEIAGGDHCIVRLDHDGDPTIDGFGTNRVKMASFCGSDTEVGDPAYVLFGVYPPGEGPQAGAGPPAPPPYIIIPPAVGTGEFYPGGHADCSNLGTGSCLVTYSCFADTGPGPLGPNILAKMTVLDPEITPDSNAGFLDMVLASSVKACDAVDPTLDGNAWGAIVLPITQTDPAGSSPTSWRTAAGSATDLDGDTCTDLQELDTKTRPKNCGDDPYNPLDSNKTDFSGSYEIRVRIIRAEATPGYGGGYFSCLADIQQTGDGKTDGDLTARAFCYTDTFFSVVNAVGYPGVTGDGFPGGSPPFGAIPAVDAPETNCARGLAGVDLDEDGDTVINDGCPSEAFGDMDSKHTVLTGRVNNTTNNLELRGCFEDEDASSSLGNVYVEMAVNKNTGVGTVDIWVEQDIGNCNGTYAFGGYESFIGDPPAGAYDDAESWVVRQPGGKTRDTDQDGIPNAVELRDNGTTDCGLRDPFNPYDWYDVNQDGVIDLLNDILGVIQHYAPGGAPPYDVNWDRPPSMTGGAGHWNRGAPDGVIDLLNDILGVIQQYHPGAC